MSHLYSVLWRICTLSVTVSLLLATLTARAQAPAWQTAVLAGNTGNITSSTYVAATATDAAGNVYVAGSIAGTVSFDGIALSSAGSVDGYVAKWSRISGSFVWAQRLGGPGSDEVTALAVSGSSLYLTGYFNQTAAFGAVNLASAGSDDAFVAKLSDAGATSSFAWALRGGGSSADRTLGLAVSGNSVYLTGFFNGNVSFGSATLINAGQADVFVAKLTDAGPTASFTWAQRAGGASSEFAFALAVSGSSVYIAGSFSGVAGFGSSTLSTAPTPGTTFVAKLTDAGATASFTWARQTTSISNNLAYGLAASGTSVYVSGAFSGSMGLGNQALTSAGQFDAFVTKLTDAGPTADFVWAQRAGGLGSEQSNALVSNGSAIYWAGSFNGTALFGSTTLTAAGSNTDLFVGRLTDAGTTSRFDWTGSTNGGQGGSASTLALSATGALYVGGYIVPPIAFGNLVLTSPFNDHMGFLASLQAAPTAAAAPAALVALALSPNPAHGHASVQLPAIPGTTTATLTILDVLGRSLRTQTAPASAPAELDLTGLAPGLYAVRVAAGGATATQRLVVE